MPKIQWKNVFLFSGKMLTFAMLFLLGLFFCVQIAAVLLLWMAG